MTRHTFASCHKIINMFPNTMKLGMVLPCAYHKWLKWNPLSKIQSGARSFIHEQVGSETERLCCRDKTLANKFRLLMKASINLQLPRLI